MPAAKAQALVSSLTVTDADPADDTERLDRLALWALQPCSSSLPLIRPTGW